MKTILVVLVLAAAVQAERKSLKEWKTMSHAQRLAQMRQDCPEINDVNDVELGLNLAVTIDDNVSKPPTDFDTGVTCMSGRSLNHFKSLQTLTLKEEAKNRPKSNAPSRRRRQAVPATYDARPLGLTGPVLNQGNCGSCWTFSAAGAMEGAIKKKTGTLPALSQQNMVDCVTASNGCNGGWMGDAFDYSKTNGGIDNSTVYKYLAVKQSTCKYTTTGNVLPKMTNYNYTTQGDETDLKIQLYNRGVISVAMQAGTTEFQNYVGGIYSCTNFTGVDHGVLLVGYGTNTTSGQDFWIVKNSWGPNWGEQGYFRVIRNKGSSLACGIPDYAHYPII
jgi:C1A family cysteine protease